MLVKFDTPFVAGAPSAIYVDPDKVVAVHAEGEGSVIWFQAVKFSVKEKPEDAVAKIEAERSKAAPPPPSEPPPEPPPA